MWFLNFNGAIQSIAPFNFEFRTEKAFPARTFVKRKTRV